MYNVYYVCGNVCSSFKDNPHPDEKERLALGKKLNLENKQVKFWFQNRRTQMKVIIEYSLYNKLLDILIDL